MKNSSKNRLITIIGILIVLLFIQGWYYKSSIPTQTVVTKIETKYDTITTTSVEYVPQIVNKIIPEPYYIEVLVTDTVLVDVQVDTAQILQEYFTQNIYIDTLSLDTLGSIVVTDTISQNKIQSRQFTSDITVPVKTVNTTTIVNDKGFYVGAGLGINNQMLHSVSGEFLYKTKRNMIYGIGFGLGRDNLLLSPAISGRVYWEIGKKNE